MRKFVPLALVFAALVAAFFAVFGDKSFERLNSLQRTLAAQRERNESLQATVNELNSQVTSLQTSDRALEKAVRNELRMARPDELIFIFDKTNKSSESSRTGIR